MCSVCIYNAVSLCRSFPLFAKVHGKEQGSLSPKPPVSKVRPMMEDSAEDKTPASPDRSEGPK